VSPVDLHHFATNGFVYNILTCRNVVDKSVVSPANPLDVLQVSHVDDLLQTCCRQIRCVASNSTASRQQVYSKSV
jgi:hypothetical protein